MAKSTASKGSATRTKRRTDLRRASSRPSFEPATLLRHPELIRGSLILLLFAIAISTIAVWSREQLRLNDGQIMTETRLKRLDYVIEDELKTETLRQEAREKAPQIYAINKAHLDELRSNLLRLPPAVEGKTDLEEINEQLLAQFRLTADGLAALQEFVADGEPTAAWRGWVACLIDEQLIHVHPIIDSKQYQLYQLMSLNKDALLELPDGTTYVLSTADPSAETGKRAEPIQLRDPGGTEFRNRLQVLVADRCGFPEAVVPYVMNRLLTEPKPTIRLEEQLTAERAERDAAMVEPAFIPHKAGEVLYRRGDLLTSQQRLEVENEDRHYAMSAGAPQLWIPRSGVIGLCITLSVLLGLFAAFNYPRLVSNWLRSLTLCTLIAGLLLLTATITVRGPHFLYLVAIGCTLFVAVVIRLAYDQRLALVIAAVQCSLVAIALDRGVGLLILLMAGSATFIAQLGEIRNRNTMIRAASVTAVVLAIGSVILGLFEIPAVPGVWRPIISNVGWSAAASFGVGFIVLGILPSIEKLFDITTGMTLAELRDPKQPLLRQLQQRAPGTYNHSLQVANICEAAADAIGANGLLLYVGALYHDVGKLNKPEYFIENQTDGYNRHEKLSPAMSLLVIIGHVKDGIELAREYNLPRPMIHFIESHHGTTLVEYFYHAAKTQAEAAEKSAVDEVVFRYPGPKPRTREAAILMLSDAVESATRALAEPTPSRIESLVRDISRKRLTDGQFDQCPLTFRELGLIEDSIISRLCAIHHGRISYPSAKTAAPAADPSEPKQASA